MKKMIILFVCTLLMCGACKHSNPLIGNELLASKIRMGLLPNGCLDYFKSVEADRKKASKDLQKTCETWAQEMVHAWQQTGIIDKKATLDDLRDVEYWKSIK